MPKNCRHQLGASQTPGRLEKALRNLKTIATSTSMQLHMFASIKKMKCLPEVNHFWEIPGLVVGGQILDDLSTSQNLSLHHTDTISHKLSRATNPFSALFLPSSVSSSKA
jgi:hypothetical protein